MLAGQSIYPPSFGLLNPMATTPNNRSSSHLAQPASEHFTSNRSSRRTTQQPSSTRREHNRSLRNQAARSSVHELHELHDRLSSKSTLNMSSRTQQNPANSAMVTCGNCKLAHTACNNKRPCSRCIRLSKQDTCVDAIFKKRGRPTTKKAPRIRKSQIRSWTIGNP
eukprot:jgi/Hompol1/480/HPOL_004483-RA